jgi:hypothetical protein
MSVHQQKQKNFDVLYALCLFYDSNKTEYGCYTGRKISVSLGYVAVSGERKMERARGSKTPYALSLPLPSSTSAGHQHINEARRYLATSIVMG